MNCESKRKLKEYVEVEEVKQLKKRVANLEEETHQMMQEMSQNSEERKTLLNEVYRKLKLVQFSLHPQNQSLEYKFHKEGGRADGLCQVLYDDLNPSVVIRAHSVAVSNHGESSMSNILYIEYSN